MSGPPPPPLILDRYDPLPTAQRFVRERFNVGGHTALQHYRGDFFAYNGTHYQKLEPEELRAGCYKFLERALTPYRTTLVPFKPTQHRVNQVLDAVAAEVLIDSTHTMPYWLKDPAEGFDPEMIVTFTNGLLFLPNRKLLPHTPTFFSNQALDFPFNPQFGTPKRWHQFLDQLWGHDPDSIRSLQEICGYLLTPDTRQHKLFIILGPKRAGKGTLARVLTRLIQEDNVCAPTLSSLTKNFGLQPLIGKRLAIISDARLGGRADQQQITERLLSISGEDSLTIDRKYQKPWTGKLSTRFLILTNELPRLADTSGALPSRAILLKLTKSFYGKEDIHLTERLLKELPGILLWSIEGWERLQNRGYFEQPKSSELLMDELEELSSPILAFVRDCCVTGPGEQEECDRVYRSYQFWCDEQGRKPSTLQTFCRDLRAAVPGIDSFRPRNKLSGGGGSRPRWFRGIAVRRFGPQSGPRSGPP